MSSLTKQQLQNELINHGVQLPPSGSKKDEYVRAYNEHVAHDTGSGDFSSDDDLDAGGNIGSMSKEDSEEFVNQLSDKALYDMLVDLRQTVGPVVETTRPVYKHLLNSLLTGEKTLDPRKDEPATTTNGNGIAEPGSENGHSEEYSDSDREPDTPKDTKDTRTTRTSGNSEFEDYFYSFEDARKGIQKNPETEIEKKKGRSSPRQTSSSRRDGSPSTSATGRGTPTKFTSPKLPDKDTPFPTLNRKQVQGNESTPPAMYRRTPTPNPQLATHRSNLAPRSLDLEPEPTTCLKRKTFKKPEAGKSTNGNNQNDVEYNYYSGPNLLVVFMIIIILVLAFMGFIWYSFSGANVSEDEIVDMEIDEILKSLE